MIDMVRPDVAAMAPYQPIVPFDVLSQRLNLPVSAIAKLDANENPYGPAPAARRALAQTAYPHIYPDPESRALCAEIAAFTGVAPERLLAGAGADELLDLVLRAVLQPGDGVINCPPTFGMYPFLTSLNVGTLLNVPRRADFSLDIDMIEATAPQAKLLFICSPNNPDGSVITSEALRRLLALPLLVVLDEAYVEFSGDSLNQMSRINWVADHDNLAVIRTFSKWAGLAGLRAGYGAFPSWLVPHLWKIKQPYNVNVAATTAAIGSLQDTAWLQDKVTALIRERVRLQQQLARIRGIEPFPSRANFVLCRVHEPVDAAWLKQALEAEGILVRYFAKPGLENCIRISAGRPEDGDRLLAALRRLL